MTGSCIYIRESGKEAHMMPDPKKLIEQLGLATPLVAVYDSPDTAGFEPLVAPEPGKHVCLFRFYPNILKGETLLLTKDTFGCGGAGSCLFGVKTRSREDYVKFLYEGEGLKCSREVMEKWFDARRSYAMEHPFLLIGPMREDKYGMVKTVTFFAAPDALSGLIIGAHYCSAPGDPPAVLAPFGSGCMELLPLFEDLGKPQAIIGATDVAMRQYLPPDILAFTVTKPMFEQLCGLDEKSFLFKPFLKNLKKARKVLLR
jgi:hypothetical protein